MASNVSVWLDGVPGSALPLPDRGLDFGDGLFETLLLENGRALFRQAHLERLRVGLAALALPDCSSTAEQHLERVCADIVSRGWPWAALRITVTRGAGERGYAAPAQVTPRIIITASPIQHDCRQMPQPAALVFADLRLSSEPFLAGVKHLNRLEQVIAATQARQAQADESVLLDHSGRVVSVAAGNLFFVVGKELVTPPLAACPIHGTRRRLVIEQLAPALGLDIREARVESEFFSSCDEVFFTNSLQGLRPVKTLGSASWETYPVCEALFEQYLREVDLCAG
ncbi:MAG: aminodeoxychorismate lyase [Halieaceae bacterium]|nr:aminodeoxychorismate lyase [Halieaceae bacterium]